MKQEQIKRDTVVSFGDFLNNDATPDAILKQKPAHQHFHIETGPKRGLMQAKGEYVSEY